MKTQEILTSGTLHSSQIFQYKTKDGRAVFAFSYEYEYGYYVISIHKHPSYNGRNEMSTVAHHLPYPKSPLKRKVCFTSGKEPKTLEQAKKFSTQWAELTWRYIKTGITIDNQLISRN